MQISPLRRTGAAIACCALLAGCSLSPDAGNDSAAGVTMREVAPARATGLPGVVTATGRLGLAMLADAAPGANAVVSPSSLAMALAMLTEGARGRTLAELEAALGASGDARRDAFAALRGSFAALDGDPAVVQHDELPAQPVVHLAGQVVVDDGYDLLPAYLTALADGFGAGVRRTDLGSPGAKKVLGDWVREHTGGLVKDSAIEPSPGLRVVLQDAILLAARWETPFLEGYTSDRPFTLADGTQVTVETMTTNRGLSFAEADGWAAVRLPYAGGRLHADLLLPPKGSDPVSIDPATLAGLTRRLDSAQPSQVSLTLPTLELEPDALDLKALLHRLTPSALCGAETTDFSGIGPEALCVQQAVQQAVLVVDEEGTKAAAVTEIGMAASGPAEPEHTLLLDRPFLLQIADKTTGWPLFLAAVRDPRH